MLRIEAKKHYGDNRVITYWSNPDQMQDAEIIANTKRKLKRRNNMDPDSTLQIIIQALVDDDNLGALVALRDLMDWLNNKGFMPDLTAIEKAIHMMYDH